MNKSSSSRFLVLAIVFVMLLPSILQAHAAPTYAAGVSVGQWASYAPLNVTYRDTTGFISEPQYVKDLNETVSLTSTVQTLYTTTNVTVQVVSLFKNSTMRTEIENGDLMTGDGNLTYGIISSGLSSGDAIWSKTDAPTINYTIPMTYLGESRTVNVLNTTTSTPTGYGDSKLSLEYIWDQTSGIVLEAKFLIVESTAIGDVVVYTDVKITATNIFSGTTPDFQIFVNPAALSVVAGSSVTATVTLTSVNGFTGLVSLAADPSSYASLSPSSITLSFGGTQTSTLTFSTTSSTSPGSYGVTITGTGYLTHHDAVVGVTVTASGPYFTVVASHPSSVTSGLSATSAITVAAYNDFSGTVTLTDTVPSGLTCNAITPSTLTNYGTASISCSSTTPGTYTVTITATSGTTSHTTATTITVVAAPSQTPSTPATILGIDPTLFYSIIGIVIVVIAAIAFLGMRSMSKKRDMPAPPVTTPQ